MKKIICVSVVLMLLLSGCSSFSKVDEDKVKDISEKITKTIIDSVEKGIDAAEKNSAERKESHKIEASETGKLEIESSVGDIYLTTHDSTEATIDIKITARADSKEKSQELVDSFDYSVEEKWNTIKIDTKLDDVKLLSNNNMQTELTINIPKNIEIAVISLNVGEIIIDNTNGHFEVTNNVGDIKISNSDGSFNLKSDVGEITLNSCRPSGNTELKTNTGDIKATFYNISDAQTIKAETAVGDIEMSTPDNSSYEAKIDEFMKGGMVMFKGNKDTKIDLKTGVGEIQFK
ncbi:hypothetical protein HZF24_17670 [Sedimentibacter hydroxybenzoicus DSM 7310]|uniref:Adhesin n=1 Tax=Sedimentibacter hydroxybenzoicus DSM 7310 TaxID=1123245 RepID=A0A974BNH1_SEDHY|nr:DUF4097 family beta strand repeat-containing protein [Sedimentibacter hydroxybenzoicus]NYB75980.1 hypothetical protein [Sedimentibacter hydroxybenzoicus DSM 7310]